MKASALKGQTLPSFSFVSKFNSFISRERNIRVSIARNKYRMESVILC